MRGRFPLVIYLLPWAAGLISGPALIKWRIAYE